MLYFTLLYFVYRSCLIVERGVLGTPNDIHIFPTIFSDMSHIIAFCTLLQFFSSPRNSMPYFRAVKTSGYSWCISSFIEFIVFSSPRSNGPWFLWYYSYYSRLLNNVMLSLALFSDILRK